MSNMDLIAYAKEAGYDAVAIELGHAQDRARDNLWTEAVMRLGRATEATLYAAAREFGVKIQLHIPQLSDLQTKLRGHESKILKLSSSTEEVKKLADISKQLSQTIALLMESESSREGAEGERPRGNDSILNELIAAIDDSGAKRRLGAVKLQLQTIMQERNAGAHASPNGDPRETDPAIFPNLASEFEQFIRTVIDVAVGERSRKLQLPQGTLEETRV
jgi:hypothetical protein